MNSFRNELAEIIWLLIKIAINRLNLQRFLFLASFLTYGVGDGLTAVYMIEKNGIMSESNPIIRFMYLSSGAQGVISFKIWFTFMILYFVWTISSRTNTYWTINGFLSALCVGGLMAIRANLMMANGMTPPPPASIIMAFLFLTVLFVMIGDQMDKINTPTERAKNGLPS